MSRRALIASLLFAVVGALFGLVYIAVNHLNQNISPFHTTVLFMGLSVGISLFIQPLFFRIRNLIDKLFFHEYYKRNVRFSGLGQELLRVGQEAEFNRIILETIDTSFKIVRVDLFIWDEKSRTFRLQARSTWGKPQKFAGDISFPSDHPIPGILQKSEFCLFDRAKQYAADEQWPGLAAAMRNLEASLLIPIKKDYLLGFLVLGEKESGLPYSVQDIEGLRDFARMTAVVSNTEQLMESRKELEKWTRVLETRVKESTRELKSAQEELLKKNRLAIIGEVVSMVSHELKNPLGVINTSSYFLENRLAGSEDPALLKHARMVSSQADSMNRIISAILDYCRSRELILQEGHINELLTEVLASIQRPSGVLVSMNLSPSVPVSKFDKTELRQAMVNLVSNGIEAIGENGQLSVRTEPRGKNRIIVEVKDTGCGISETNLPRIFDPLFTTKSNGTGLGLAVVKKVVDRHGGEIAVESAEGRGSTFTVSLPVNMNRQAA